MDCLTLFEAVQRSRSYGEHRARCLLYRPVDSILSVRGFIPCAQPPNWRLLGNNRLARMNESSRCVYWPATRVTRQHGAIYGCIRLRERNGGTLVALSSTVPEDISMARTSFARRTQRTIVGAAKSSAASVKKTMVKAATAAAPAAAKAAVESVIHSMKGRESQ